MKSMETHKLYPYQEVQIEHLVAAYEDHAPGAIVVAPTGSGKSASLRAALSLAAPRAALVITPQILLESSLSRSESYSLTHRGVETKVSFPTDRWRILRDEQDPWNWRGFGLCTHARARLLPREKIDLSRVILVVDEAHHQGHGTDLYQFVRWAIGCGAHVWLFTATPERRDRQSLLPPGVEARTHVLSPSVLMDHGWPRRVVVRTASGPDRSARVAGELRAEDYDVLCELIKQTRRQTLVAVTAGSSVLLAQELVKTVVTRGIRAESEILVTTGDDRVDGVHRSDFVAAAVEREKKLLREGKYDQTSSLVVDCRRLVEGVDLPGLSAVIFYGVPSSLLEIIQRIGRVMRKKAFPNFPPEWAEEVHVTFLVGASEKEDRQAVERLVQIAAYFYSPALAYDLMVFWEGLAARVPERMARHIRERSARPPEEELQLRANLLRLGVPGLGGKGITVEKFLANVDAHTDDPQERAALVEAFLTSASVDDPQILARMKAIAADVFGTPLAEAPPEVYENRLAEGYRRVAQEFSGLIVRHSDRVLSMLEGALTSEGIREIGGRLAQERDAVYNQTSESLWKLVTAYRSKTGREFPALFPVEEDLSEFVGYRYTARDLDRAARRQWGLGLDKLAVLVRYGAFQVTPEAASKMDARVVAEHERRLDSAATAADLRQACRKSGLHKGLPRLAVAAACRYGWTRDAVEPFRMPKTL